MCLKHPGIHVEKSFWLERWQAREIGFHEGQANTLLTRHWDQIALQPPARVFLPLCGKTRDIHWFLSQGYAVVGVEFSAQAVKELFTELKLPANIRRLGALELYQAPGLDIYVGDIFALDPAQLGPIDAIYDRAALVALPAQTRDAYARKLQDLTPRAVQFLISFAYDQTAMPGPPFSVPLAAIEQLYGDRYAIQALAERRVAGGLMGQQPALEQAWKLQPHLP